MVNLVTGSSLPDILRYFGSTTQLKFWIHGGLSLPFSVEEIVKSSC